MESELIKHFYRGRHREVVRLALDSSESHFSHDEVPAVVGALAFVGRVDEAEKTYLLREATLSNEEKIAARFFVGIGLCRKSDYARSDDYFAQNLRERKLVCDGQSLFYVFQGIGFRQFFHGKLLRALKYSERAFDAAFEAKFLYGRALASDLKGHSLVQTGQVGLGIATLEEVKLLTESLGILWLNEAVVVSLLSYRSQFGLSPKTIIDDIQAQLSRMSKEDVYSQTTLLLTLAQEYLRRGRLGEAKETLNQCCAFVYGYQNRWHAALLNLRYAYLHYLEGDSFLALNLVRNALTQINLKVDLILELKLRGWKNSW